MEADDRRDRVFDELAVVGSAFGSAERLELVELLAQGERIVDGLARAAGMGVSTVSAHLQVLKLAALVLTRREGTKHIGRPVAGRRGRPVSCGRFGGRGRR